MAATEKAPTRGYTASKEQLLRSGCAASTGQALGGEGIGARTTATYIGTLLTHISAMQAALENGLPALASR